MTNKAVKYGIVGIAVVLFIVVIFAGTASAGDKDIRIANAGEWGGNITYFGLMGNDDTIFLTGDIDFSELGQSSVMISSFKGKIEGYDGSVCHKISNFSISGGSNSNIGLIGTYYGISIRNVTICNFSVSGWSTVGGLVGYACSENECTFENVTVINGEVSIFDKYAGEVFGCANYARKNIVNCVVLNCSVSGGDYLGGLVGYEGTASLYVTGSRVDSCDILGGSSLGGLIGAGFSASVYVTDTWVNGSVISGGDYLGGLVGRANTACVGIDLLDSGVVNCVIKSKGQCGGCLGCNAYQEDVTRTVNNCTVRNCVIYATEGNTPCGGIIGICVQGTSQSDYPSVSNCRVEFCTIAGQGSNAAGGIAGTFPTAGKLDGNEVISGSSTF